METSRTMQAARVHQAGPPEAIVVEPIAVPEPGAGEILVRVHAAGVGPWDALLRTGTTGLPVSFPLTLGSEISGVVEKLGPDTTGFAPGQEVFGATNALFINGYAEYAVASAGMLAGKPATLTHNEAASVPVVAVTAWQMLFDHAQAREGQTVVVHGAAGNVGAYAVQLARWRGLRVIATTRGHDADELRRLGADEVLDSRAGFANAPQRADVVIDTVGGEGQAQLFALVKEGGIVVSAVAQPDEQTARRHGARADFFIVDVTSSLLTRLGQMFDRKELTTSVGSVLPLAQARAAHEMLAGTRPHARGKIVLQVGG